MKNIFGNISAITVRLLCVIFASAAQLTADSVTAPESGYILVKRHVLAGATHATVPAPEGQFIAVNNAAVIPWITNTLDMTAINAINSVMRERLEITLNEKGFAPAATRNIDDQPDTTNYDAIWVRDNMWVYFALDADPARQDDARRLLLALWDYYATPAQIARFKNVIADPALALDQMAVPHIRFDGRSDDLADVTVDGKPETWNHRQIDAHGLFFSSLGEAFETGRLEINDLTATRFNVLSLYPLFLQRINFHEYEDAGAWEEIPRRNTSSIGLATRSLQVWQRILYPADPSGVNPLRGAFFRHMRDAAPDTTAVWGQAALQTLIDNGLLTVKRQLKLGGESPDYPPDDMRFRLADAALLFVIAPTPLTGLTEEELRKALTIVETLQRPMGVLRYNNDSYQAGNYWITPAAPSDASQPTLTGDTSSPDAFQQRLSRLPPHTEAQWFFDSIMALARLRLAAMTTDSRAREQDMHYAAIHLKRTLGQITGDAIACDGQSVRPWQMPESIGAVIIDGHNYYLPSPITPLNWSKAALKMALNAYAKALAVGEE